MKSNKYMDRALRSRDRRYAHILGKLGYERSDMRARTPDDTASLRAEYQRLVSKRPFMGWDAATLKAKIAEATAPAPEPEQTPDPEPATAPAPVEEPVKEDEPAPAVTEESEPAVETTPSPSEE